MENIKITIAENGTTTLATSGKYCDRNIDVEVNVPTGGGGDSGLPEEALLLTGDLTNKFYSNHWTWFIEKFGDQITTKDITALYSMFYYSTVEEIPFALNCDSTKDIGMTRAFSDSKIKKAPTITNCYPYEFARLFEYCEYLREIPDDFVNGCVWDRAKANTTTYLNCSAMFNGCSSIREIPFDFLNSGAFPKSKYSYCIYKELACNCYALDSLKLPCFYTATWTSSAFSGLVSGCCRLKELTFDVQADGTPYTQDWKNQTIDLSYFVGYGNSESNIINYNSGITADKKVYDDATYQALKDDPDWFATDINYSRYNHDSAVNTINSLPDTSAYLAANGGTNTIKFTGSSGTLTDGGAINTLTEEEIAVAAAKGWTVSLV